MAATDEKRILCVGLCCLDIISVVKSFPVEDTDQRSLDYYWQRGGNASNSATVISLLGGNVEFLGTFVKGHEYGYFERSFASLNISIDNCRVYEEGEAGRCPVAVIIVNKENASRTIMAALDKCVELKYEDFEKVNLEKYKWIHIEGRYTFECLKRIIERIAAYNETVDEVDKVKVSIELEKVKATHLVPLAESVDYVFMSKEFAAAQGYKNKEDAVEGFSHKCNQSGTVICAWAEDGAAAKQRSGAVFTSSIFPPKQLLDTLGAGDTFNAATILALSNGHEVSAAITYGCKIAGAKCGMVGYSDLKHLNTDM